MSVSKISLYTIRKLNKNGVVLKNVSLASYTTFKVGGCAKYFIIINTLEGFINVIKYLQEHNFPYFIIGNGSKLLISDDGYKGAIIKFLGDFDVVLVKDDEMECGAGVMLSKAYQYAYQNSLSGFEQSVGIPASVGGATYMNASAFDFEMAKIIDYVIAYDGNRIVYFDKKDCNFGYRKSIFQNDKYIILRVGFKLKKTSKDKLQSICKETLQKRLLSQPKGVPNAGSVFKRFDGIVVSKLLDEMGSKKYFMGGAKVSLEHSNFIINYDNAKASDIYKLIMILKKDFFEKYNIKLDIEIKFLGDFDEITR